jgi:hypothetical protein
MINPLGARFFICMKGLIRVFKRNFSITTGNFISRVARDLLKSASVPAFGDPSLLLPISLKFYLTPAKPYVPRLVRGIQEDAG